MLTEDTFQYALENTRIIVPPQQRVETFGSSRFNYYLVTENMDVINVSRVREGEIQAERPRILSPAYFTKLLVEGFGEKAQAYAQQISENAEQFTFLKYGFRMKKTESRFYEVHEPMQQVVERVKADVAGKNDPLAALLTGVDDGWEVCLLKFMFDVVQASAGGNIRDFKQRGFL